MVPYNDMVILSECEYVISSYMYDLDKLILIFEISQYERLLLTRALRPFWYLARAICRTIVLLLTVYLDMRNCLWKRYLVWLSDLAHRSVVFIGDAFGVIVGGDKVLKAVLISVEKYNLLRWSNSNVRIGLGSRHVFGLTC